MRLSKNHSKYLHVIFTLVFSCGLFLHPLKVRGQNVEDSLMCQMDYYRVLDSFNQYYHSVDMLDEFYIRNDNIKDLFYNSLNYDYLPQTQLDSFLYRKYLLYHSYNLQRYGGSVVEGQKYLLKAHDYVKDKDFLDELAYKIEKKIATNYDRLKDYDNAYYFYQKVINNLRVNEDYGSLSRVYADQGNSYLFNKKPIESLNTLKKGYALGLKSKNEKGIIANLINLADYFLYANNFKEFNIYYYKAESYLMRLDKDNQYYERLAGFQMLKGDFYLKNKEYKSALLYFNKSFKNYKLTYNGYFSREISKLLIITCEIYKELGDLNNFEKTINEGLRYLLPNYNNNKLPSKHDLYNENSFINLFALKADFLHLKFIEDNNLIHLDTALNYLELASYVNFRLHDELTVEQSKLASIEMNRALVEKSLAVLSILYDKAPSKYYLKKAEVYFWRSKNQNLIELNNRQKLKKSLNKEDLKMVESLEDSILYLERISINGRNLDSLKSLKIEYLNQIDELLINGVQEEQNTAFPFIDYVVTDSVIYYLNNFDTISFGVIPNQQRLKDLVEKILNDIQDQASEDLLKVSLNQAYSILFPMGLHSIKSLKIIPDKYLSALPFDLLVDKDYLIYSKNIFYGISGFDESDYQGSGESKLLYLVKPTYSKTNKNIYESELRSGNYALPYLEPEITEVAGLWKGQAKVSSGGGFLKIMNEARDFDIFHYAGHAISYKDSSHLIYEDNLGVEIINENQITNWPNVFKLVVLSACQTGVGEYNSGEGFESLCNGFIKAGAQSVIYSLWSLNDQSTSAIVGKMYKNLVQGEEKSQALRNAKLDYINQANPMKRHPFYWSGFALVGNNLPIASKPNNNSILWVAFLFLTILLIYKSIKK